MNYDLQAIAKRLTNRRRRVIVLRDIVPPAVLSSDLYAAAYRPVVDLWSRAAERVIAEYGRTLSAMTTDAPADLQSVIDDAAAEFQRLFLLLRPALSGWAIRVEKYQREKWRGAVLSATGIDLSTLIGPQDVAQTVEAAIEWNVSLVRDVSDQARKKIADAVFDGLRNRSPARDVGKVIGEATGFARRRAKNIAADQLSKLSSSLADERRRQAGIDQWEWKWSHKLHGRPEHIARDGKIYADTEAGADPANGVLPPPPDLPAQLPFCGCRSLARLVFS